MLKGFHVQKPWTHLLTASQDQAADVLYGAPKVEKYKETMGATKDQGVAVGYCVKLKTQTQDNSGLLQKAAIAIGQLTHRAFPE
jgi:hypothetical protein